jgi:hypothetical protein
MRRSKKGLRCVELEGTYECQRYSEFSCTGWILLRRFIEDKQAHDRVAQEGQAVRIDACL